jgi:hypothetical protein
MSTNIIEDASRPIALLGTCSTEEAMLANPECQKTIHSILQAISRYLTGFDEAGPVFSVE